MVRKSTAALLDRAVVDLLAGVVAGVRRRRRPTAERRGRPRSARRPCRRGSRPARRRTRPSATICAIAAWTASSVGEPDVPQLDVRLHRLELDPEPQGVAERAVGVREGAEEVGVLAVGRRDDDLAGAGEDVHLEDRLVGQPVAERRRLDAQPGDRAAEGDRLQLRHDEGHQAVGQGRVDQVLVGRHPLDVGGAGLRVDRDDLVQPRDVEPGAGRVRPGPEEVGGALGQPDRLARRDRGVLLEQVPGGLGVVGQGCPRRCLRHDQTLVTSFVRWLGRGGPFCLLARPCQRLRPAATTRSTGSPGVRRAPGCAARATSTRR